jgi:hypothetical protein
MVLHLKIVAAKRLPNMEFTNYAISPQEKSMLDYQAMA